MSAKGAPDRVLILDQSIKVLYQSILVLAVYFLMAGHNLPGGGFVGGRRAHDAGVGGFLWRYRTFAGRERKGAGDGCDREQRMAWSQGRKLHGRILCGRRGVGRIMESAG